MEGGGSAGISVKVYPRLVQTVPGTSDSAWSILGPLIDVPLPRCTGMQGSLKFKPPNVIIILLNHYALKHTQSCALTATWVPLIPKCIGHARAHTDFEATRFNIAHSAPPALLCCSPWACVQSPAGSLTPFHAPQHAQGCAFTAMGVPPQAWGREGDCWSCICSRWEW